MALSIGRIFGLLELQDNFTSRIVSAGSTLEAFSSKLGALNADKLAKQLDSVGAAATKAGTTMTVGLTLPIVGLAAAALRSGEQFEGAMNRVQAALDAPEEQMNALRAAAERMGADTVFSSTEAAQAMVELGKAGFTAQQAIDALPSTLQLAIAGSMDLNDAATLTSNTMKTFGLSVTDLGHANDVLAKAANSSTIDVRDLAEGFKYVGPVAHAAGVSLETVSAAMALLGEAGIKGSMAGTTLRNVMTTLMSPTDKQAGLMKELGLQSAFANGKLMPMADILKILEGQSGKTAEILELFGDRAGPGMVAMVDKGSAALTKLDTALQNSDGYAQRAADTMMKGLPGAMERLRGGIDTLFTKLNKTLEPAFVAIANTISNLADFITSKLLPAFDRLPTVVKMGTVAMLAMLAAAGPLLLAIGGIATGISTLIPGLSVLKATLHAISMNTTVMTAQLWLMEKGITASAIATRALAIAQMALPWVALIAALAAVGYGLYKLITAYDLVTRATDAFTNAFPNLTRILSAIVSILRDSFVIGWNLARNAMVSIVDYVQTTATAAWSGFKTLLGQVASSVGLIGGAALLAFPPLRDLLKLVSLLPSMGNIADRLEDIAKGAAAARLAMEGSGPSSHGFSMTGPKPTLSTGTGLFFSGPPPAGGAAAGMGGYTPQALRASADAAKSYGQEVAEAERKIKGLSATQRNDLTRALRDGVLSVSQLNDKYKVGEFAIELYGKKVKAGAEAMEASAKASREADENAEKFGRMLRISTSEPELYNQSVRAGIRLGQQQVPLIDMSKDIYAKLGANLKDLNKETPYTDAQFKNLTATMRLTADGLSAVTYEETKAKKILDEATEAIERQNRVVRARIDAFGELGQMIGSAIGGEAGRIVSSLAGGITNLAHAMRDASEAGISVGSSMQVAQAGFGLAFAAVQMWSAAIDRARQRRREELEFLDEMGGVRGLNAAGLMAGLGPNAGRTLRFDDNVIGVKQMRDAIDAANERLERYNLTWRDLGLAVRQANIDKIANDLIQDWRALEGAGVDTTRAMAGGLSQIVIEAVKTGTKVPVALQPMLDKLIRAGQLSEEAAKALLGIADDGVPSLEDITAAADRYGLKLDELGPKVQQLRIDAIADQLAKDWDILIRSGADANVVMGGMRTNVQDIITKALTMGLTVPESMRPIIEAMIAAGLLTDQFGKKLGDTSQINFSTPLTKSIDALIAKLGELIDKLSDVGNAAGDAIGRVRDAANEPTGTAIPRPPNTPPADTPPGTEDANNGNATGGGRTPKTLTANIILDGRRIGRAVTPVVAEELDLHGVMNR